MSVVARAIAKARNLVEKYFLRCGRTQKHLASITSEGMYLYCKDCKQEHLFTWERIQSQLQDAIKKGTGLDQCPD